MGYCCVGDGEDRPETKTVAAGDVEPDDGLTSKIHLAVAKTGA
jgi:hypothetical protein